MGSPCVGWCRGVRRVCVCVCVVGRTMYTAHRTKTMPQQAFGIALELRAPRAPVSLPLVIPHCPCTKGRPWALVFFRRPHCFTLSAPWGPGEQLSLPFLFSVALNVLPSLARHHYPHAGPVHTALLAGIMSSLPVDWRHSKALSLLVFHCTGRLKFNSSLCGATSLGR